MFLDISVHNKLFVYCLYRFIWSSIRRQRKLCFGINNNQWSRLATNRQWCKKDKNNSLSKLTGWGWGCWDTCQGWLIATDYSPPYPGTAYIPSVWHHDNGLWGINKGSEIEKEVSQNCKIWDIIFPTRLSNWGSIIHGFKMKESFSVGGLCCLLHTKKI